MKNNKAKLNSGAKQTKMIYRKRGNHKQVILFLILFAAFFGGAAQLFRYHAVMAHMEQSNASGISFTSVIPSNVDASREGRSYEPNVTYTGATGLQGRFQLINGGTEDLTNIGFFIRAPSLVTLDDVVTFSNPDYNDLHVTYTTVVSGDTIDFEIPILAAGESLQVTFFFDTTGIVVSSPQEVEFTYLITTTTGASDLITLLDSGHSITILPPPTDRIIAIFLITAAIFLALMYLSWSGAFAFFSTEDLIMIAIIGAIQTVYVQIIGRQFVFPVVDRVPGGFFFAIGDLPYVFLLIAAVSITRKPGTVSLTLFVYNITSEIGWYGLNPLWWMYPFAQGLAADLYILIRGRGIFTSERTWFNWSSASTGSGVEGLAATTGTTATPIPDNLFLDDDMDITELKAKDTLVRQGTGMLGIFDGAAIGFMRGFFMQLSLYVVFYPNLFHVFYNVNYFTIIVFTWAIGNAIAGAISVPIARVVEEALSF